MELVIALLAFVVVCGHLAWAVVRRRDGLPVLDRYVVTLASGEAFDGLLASSKGGVLRLVDAYALNGQDRITVDGELFLDRSKVAYVQRPGGSK